MATSTKAARSEAVGVAAEVSGADSAVSGMDSVLLLSRSLSPEIPCSRAHFCVR